MPSPPPVINTAVAGGDQFNTMFNATRNVWSAGIYLAALPVMKFNDFSTKKTELTGQPGKSITIPRFANLKRGGTLDEGTRMVPKAMSMSTRQIVVQEQGNAVAVTEFLVQTSFYDQMTTASILLGRDLAIVLDTQLRDTVLSATGRIFPNGKTSRTALISTDIFNTAIIRDGVEALETVNAPRWGGDHYILFIHPHQARGVKNDNDWVQASLYSGSSQIYRGEIGRFDDVRVVSTTVMPNGSNPAVNPITGEYVDLGFDPALANGTDGNQTAIYLAVMFGEHTMGHAVGLPVELRSNGIQDFGREHGLAWYAIWGQDILEDTHAVVFETA